MSADSVMLLILLAAAVLFLAKRPRSKQEPESFADWLDRQW